MDEDEDDRPEPERLRATQSTSLGADAADIAADILRAPVLPGVQVERPGMNRRAGERDLEGTPHDPVLHVSPPLLTREGRWRKRPGAAKRASMRPPGRVASPEGAPRVGSPLPGPQEDSVADDKMYDTLALLTVEQLTGACQMLGGPAWKLREHEREPMTSAWSAYYRARGIS